MGGHASHGDGTAGARLHALQGRNPGDRQLAGRGLPGLTDPHGVPQPHLHAVGEGRGAQPQQARPHSQDGHHQR